MDRGAWWATVHGVIKSRTQLNDFDQRSFHRCFPDNIQFTHEVRSLISCYVPILKKKDNLKQCGIRPFCVKCPCLCWVSRTEGAETPPFLQEISSLPPFLMCRMHTQGCRQREKGCHHSGCSKRSEHHLCLGSPCPPLPGGGGDDTEQTQGRCVVCLCPLKSTELRTLPML